MKNNKGFIATSLIYSFFLVFVAILAALLNNYIANKTILERFNDDAENDLNTKTYTVNVYGVNANLQSGMTLTNLIANGTFESEEYWTRIGDNFTYNILWGGKHSLLKNNNTELRTRLEQNIHVLDDTVYYYSINYINKDNTTEEVNRTYPSEFTDLPSPLCLTDNCSITSKNITDTWTRASRVFKSDGDKIYKFVVGDNTTTFPAQTRFTEAMVINLTSSFGPGYEPDVSWIDKNIDYFDKTITFKNFNGIEKNGSVTVKFALFKNYENYDIKCTSMDDESITRTIGDEYVTKETIEDREYATVVIDNIESNLKCRAVWSNEDE